MNGFSGIHRAGIGDHGSRRGLLGLLSAGALGGLGHAFALAGMDARKKGKKKGNKKRRIKKRCQPKPAPPRELAYECVGPPTNVAEDDGSVRHAQLFAASRGGTLREIQMVVNKEAGSSGDYTLQLLRVNGGVPAHSPLDVLAATTIANADVPDGESTLSGAFSGPELEAGADYAVAIARPGASGVRPGARSTGSGAACAGHVFSAQDLEEFEPVVNSDLVLSVFVD